MADVAKLTIYVTDITKRAEIGEARRKFFSGDFPCSTLVEIKALAEPGLTGRDRSGRRPPANGLVRRDQRRARRVDQHERDFARSRAAIDPGVVRPLLHEDVAGFHVHFGVVEQHVDLAFEDDRVVDAVGRVHVRMARRRAARRIGGGIPISASVAP